MYLTEPTLFDVVKRQTIFKFNTNSTALLTLLFLQIAGLFMGSLGNGHSFSYDGHSKISKILLTNDNSIGLTLLWAFIMGFLLTSTARRNESFVFVTNRISNHLSTFAFMLTAAIIGGFTAVLSGSAIKLFAFLRYGKVVIDTPGLVASPTDFFARIATAIAYTLLFLLISYTIGSLVQRSKLLIVVFIFGWFAFSTKISDWNGPKYFTDIIMFFGGEHSLLLFLIKISGAVLALFAVSVVVTNRLEVRN